MRSASETTHDDVPRPVAATSTPSGLRVTLVWHPDPVRIGAAWWGPFARPGDTIDLSRLEPVYSDGLPLDDPRVSRAPLQLVAAADGLECWPARGGLRFEVDGAPAGPGTRVGETALRRGVRIGLASGALLLVQRGGPPRAGPSLGLVGASEALEHVRAAIEGAARSDVAVLVLGESGTGKELVARALHAQGRRAGGPFVAVNMAALASGVATSQLFGHARGAFTGAEARASGYFGQADGGTLFLDEIGACPVDVQAQLLRALEVGEIQVVGGPTRRVDVRHVAATDADLARASADGSFRAPLFHRLARVIVALPPLRERPADVAVQAAHFARERLRELGRAWPGGREAPWLGREVVDALLAHGWPGNSRELRAVVERLVDRDIDQPACGLPPFGQHLLGVPAAGPTSPPTGPRATVERRASASAERPAPAHGSVAAPAAPDLDLAAALARADYRIAVAAELLGVSRNTLKRRMEAERIRRPVDLGAPEIVAALAREGDVRAAARALGVSEHGLRLRLTELGLSDGA